MRVNSILPHHMRVCNLFKGRILQQEYRKRMPEGQVKPNIITVCDKNVHSVAMDEFPKLADVATFAKL